VRAAIDDGSIRKEIEAQRTPGDIVDEWRAARSA